MDSAELSRIRGIVPAKLNTFSHANRTRNPEVIKKFFWHVYGMMAQKAPKFVAGTRKGPLAKNILADETIRLTGVRTAKDYPEEIRRVTAHVCVNGTWRDMVFLTNNFDWSATTIAELYKAQWEVELLFRDFLSVLRTYGIAPGEIRVSRTTICRIYGALRSTSPKLWDSRRAK